VLRRRSMRQDQVVEIEPLRFQIESWQLRQR